MHRTGATGATGARGATGATGATEGWRKPPDVRVKVLGMRI